MSILCDLIDGLYQVVYKGICAGFVVRGGVVAECAPVLRARIEWWVRVAERCSEVEW